MNNYKFIYLNNKIEFVASNIKYLHFSNNEDYWCFKQCISYYKRKIQKSEFSEENHTIVKIEKDGEELAKDTEINIIGTNFNLDEDITMTSKSVILKYLNKISADYELCDEFQQIKTMLSLLANMLSNESITFIPKEINNKTIGRYLDASLYKNELSANSYDLTYREYITFQLHILKEILENDKNNIVIFEINFLTNEYIQKIEELSVYSTVIVIFNQTNVLLENNIYIDGYDFENDNELYERMEKASNCYNLEEYKKIMKDKLYKKSIINTHNLT